MVYILKLLRIMKLKVAKVPIDGASWWKIDLVEETTDEDVEVVNDDLWEAINDRFQGYVDWSEDEDDYTFYIKSQALYGEYISNTITGFLENFASDKNIGFELIGSMTDATTGAMLSLRF